MPKSPFASPRIGKLTNLAEVRGRTPSATLLSDQSVDGLDPDPNGDGDPEETAPVTFEVQGGAAPAIIPTLGEVGLCLFVGLLLLMVFHRLRTAEQGEGQT